MITRRLRITLDIEDSLLQAVRELAAREGSTIGQVISRLARIGLRPTAHSDATKVRNGVPLLPERGETIAGERVHELMDEEGV